LLLASKDPAIVAAAAVATKWRDRSSVDTTKNAVAEHGGRCKEFSMLPGAICQNSNAAVVTHSVTHPSFFLLVIKRSHVFSFSDLSGLRPPTEDPADQRNGYQMKGIHKA
jgi:hypothetical protein